MHKKLSPSLKLALIFVLFGMSWVFLTDFLSLSFSKNNLQVYNKLQNYKGVIFILISGLLVYLVSKRLTADVAKANQEEEEALRRYNVLGMATNDAVWDLNLNTHECFTNSTLQEMFGYRVDELRDNRRWWTSNLHPEDSDRVTATMSAKLKEGSTIWQDEYRFRCKSGIYKVVFDRGFIMRDNNGNPYRIIGAMQDVTEQRSLQQMLTAQKLHHKNELALEVINAQEAERKKLGQELHDNINQLLSVVKLYIEHAQTDPVIQKEMLSKSSEYLVQAIEEIRNLSKTLITPTLKDLGLLTSIDEMIDSIRQTKKINIDFINTGFSEKQIPEIKKLMIYQIVQEQLSNVLKHSKAERVTIELSRLDQMIHLVIHDNRIGFDTQKIHHGTGLANIRNRLEVYSGSMNLNSGPGIGCTLEVKFRV